MLVFILIVTIVGCAQNVQSSAVPPLTKCVSNDAACMKASTQALIPIFAKGIPELGVAVLDPLRIPYIDASSPTLKLILKDVTGVGLQECQAKKIKYDETKSKILVKLLCTVDFTAQYVMDGSLLILPIKGEGDAHLVLNKILFTVEADLEDIVGADGVKHWQIKDWRHTYELKEKATIELENLFNGNEALGRAVKEVLTVSPNEIINEAGPEVIKVVAGIIVQNVNEFFVHSNKADLVISSRK